MKKMLLTSLFGYVAKFHACNLISRGIPTRSLVPPPGLSDEVAPYISTKGRDNNQYSNNLKKN